MSELFPFFIVLLVALVFSGVFQRFNVPWIIALIIGGIIVGPFGLQIITPDPTLYFLKYLGLVFLMFVAGLETRLSGFREVWKESVLLGFLTGAIPLIVGLIIGIAFGYSVLTIVLLGIIFISSSIAITVPMLKAKGLLHSKIGKIIVSSIVLQDVASLILLAIFLQYITPTFFPLPIFVTLFVFVLLIVALVRWGIPRLRRLFNTNQEKTNIFERDIRTVFAVLVGGVIIFELLGLHAIVAAFLIGLVLSEIIEEKVLKEKIHVLAYGLFIPIFFVMIGIDTNIEMFFSASNTVPLLLVIVVGAMATKFASGWFSARLLGFTNTQATLVGGSCIPWLSTTLAVVAVGQQYNILPEELVTALILLSIITVFVSPIIIGKTADKVKKDHFVTKPTD